MDETLWTIQGARASRCPKNVTRFAARPTAQKLRTCPTLRQDAIPPELWDRENEAPTRLRSVRPRGSEAQPIPTLFIKAAGRLPALLVGRQRESVRR